MVLQFENYSGIVSIDSRGSTTDMNEAAVLVLNSEENCYLAKKSDWQFHGFIATLELLALRVTDCAVSHCATTGFLKID